VPADAGILLPADVSGNDIADALEPRLFDPDRYAAFQAAAVRERMNVTWAGTVERMQQIWAGNAQPFGRMGGEVPARDLTSVASIRSVT
jgi:hypothetical protein